MSSSDVELVVAMIAQRRYAEAIDVLDNTMRGALTNETKLQLLVLRSDAQLKAGRLAGAFDDALEVIRAQPSHNIGYLRAGEVLRMNRQFDDAIRFLTFGNDAEPSLQLRLMIRATETDRRIAAVSSKGGLPVETLVAPPIETLTKASQRSEGARERGLTPEVSPSSNTPQPPWVAPHVSPLLGIVALYLGALLGALFLSKWVSLPLAVGAVVAVHKGEAHLGRCSDIPLSVVSSVTLCFVVTWLSPMLE